MMIPFTKMHGLGNDFVILDQRDLPYIYTSPMIEKISHRRLGVGCDQLIILERPSSSQADVMMKIFNADGQEVGACGNATRCVGALLTQEDQNLEHLIQTKAGLLKATTLDQNNVMVDLGAPIFEWQKIPLSQEADPLHLPLEFEGLKDPIALSVGNPHLIFFVYDVENIDLNHVGEHLTQHSLFPEGINIEIVEKVDERTLRMRVYERGVGITSACGTGAAASVVAAQKRGIVQKSSVTVLLDGGSLEVEYCDTVRLTGEVSFIFQGHLNPSFIQI